MDKKDLIILENLDKNSRDSLNKISKKSGLSKQSTFNRIKKLEKKGIISYLSIIDDFKIGRITSYLYIKLRGIETNRLNDKIVMTKKINNVSWITDLFGKYDLSVSFYFYNIEEFCSKLNEIFKVFKGFIAKKSIYVCKKFVILDHNLMNKKDRNSYILKNLNKKVELNLKQKKLLDLVETNARVNYVELNKKLGIPSTSIKNLLQNLIDKKIIRQYKILINYKKLGYFWNNCILEIFEGENTNNLLKELKNEPKVTFIAITHDNNIIFDCINKDMDSLKNFINELTYKHRSIISNSITLNIGSISKFDIFKNNKNIK